ncbi:ctg-2 [Pristionchus pacificus]|uniref:Ctg-2 n=1 Tax=Pristionchus pacificus TaxID=54126 RepID=A0A2A6CVJ7_PRIPA|nr:ctg-2 [Pristionchus pacificus]|eukprot:PDM82252.1 ctg-2 [Pristionchus pacificus]
MSVSSRKSSKDSKKSEESKDSKPERTEISDADKALIEELRGKIKRELDLLPAYNDDISLLRWLVGWDRKVDVVVPKIKFSLRSIYALGLHKEDFSTLDKITDYCDACSVPLQWLPGSLVGIDKDGNVLSLQMIGRLDAPSLMVCTRNSDLYRMRIAESEGVMSIIRERERAEGRQLGTSVIFDLDGMSMSMVDTVALKTIMTMLSQLQEMFPDVLRKIFVINVPNFIQLLWSLIVPALAKQTQQKIEILGDNWKDRLKEAIGDEVLFERWGGTRKHEKGEYGFVRQGGKAPAHLKQRYPLVGPAAREVVIGNRQFSFRYDKANDIPDAKLTSLKVSARNTAFVPIVVDGPAPTSGKRRLYWWWRVDSGDVGFSVLRAGEGREGVAEHDDDDVVQPRWRLQTVYVPEDGEVG